MTSTNPANVAGARAIPVVRRAEPGAPIPADYSTTPHGTIFSTTPGGTKIIYDRSTLMQLRNSPLSRTPPTNLPFIPGVTRASVGSVPHSHSHLQHSFTPASLLQTQEEESDAAEEDSDEHDEQDKHKDADVFDMEME
ncbi:eukaryotic translation initiation factor 4E binding protein [Basidiobolus meristosporus CBS 931.73]|uniref:Eukaryotic translation initiation factor 4E binding protein n=1 Tax=Basidiobolus meristosporus CBS 931.73 TaxID=1314790 RepID=A0A1Y1Z197_9FUNG|nr:eukaryotic translation initiation factor 4E binding protein [Basidiobolus meristosporus CBS 931.73]ORY04073.1 eukaryotic translation initiation factor 4E binding protein [Basidiobolus meristosporus CBS 931.73]|eukprot:ORX89378.1 eukaryotic translation initiation factor 4E binding protein [Basidiobolus meristosporus CBS 931.73]